MALADNTIAVSRPVGSRGTTIAITVCLLVIGVWQLTRAARFAFYDGGGDLDRQWVVQQYVRQRINPYPIAFDALVARYGYLAPRGPSHLKDIRIWDIPREGPNPQTNHRFGTPEATYPPTAIAVMMPASLFPRRIVRVFWVAANIVMLFAVSWELALLIGVRDAGSIILVLSVVAAWHPSASCVERGQFSLFCLWCILLARRVQPRLPVVAGLLYSLSLIKPSLAIPFMFVPLWERRIKTLGVIAVSQLALLGFSSWWLHTSPLELTRQWLSVAAYFRQGMYTIQDLINGLRLDGSLVDLGLQLGSMAALGIYSAWLPLDKRLSLLALASCIWAYHSGYDFVVLLIPAAFLIVYPLDSWWIADCALLLLIDIGLTNRVYAGTGVITHAIRWAVRFSLVIMVLCVIFTSKKRRPSEPHLDARAIHA